MTEFLALRPKTYSYLTGDNDKNRKAKDTKMCVMKQKLKFEDDEYCLKAIQFENKFNQLKKKQN